MNFPPLTKGGFFWSTTLDLMPEESSEFLALKLGL